MDVSRFREQSVLCEGSLQTQELSMAALMHQSITLITLKPYNM